MPAWVLTCPLYGVPSLARSSIRLTSLALPSFLSVNFPIEGTKPGLGSILLSSGPSTFGPRSVRPYTWSLWPGTGTTAEP